MEKSISTSGASTVTFCVISVFRSRWNYIGSFFASCRRWLQAERTKIMKDLVPRNEFGVFADAKGVAKIDSLTVADAFQKDHRNVIRDIRNLDCSDDLRLLNFEQSSYINAQ